MNRLGNPDKQELISSPEVLAALSPIQNEMQRLQTAARQLFAAMGLLNLSFNSRIYKRIIGLHRMKRI